MNTNSTVRKEEKRPGVSATPASMFCHNLTSMKIASADDADADDEGDKIMVVLMITMLTIMEE